MGKPSKRTVRKWKKELREKREAQEWLHEQMIAYEKELKNVDKSKDK